MTDSANYWQARARECEARRSANVYACALIAAGVWKRPQRRGGHSGPRNFAEGV